MPLCRRGPGELQVLPGLPVHSHAADLRREGQGPEGALPVPADDESQGHRVQEGNWP